MSVGEPDYLNDVILTDGHITHGEGVKRGERGGRGQRPKYPNFVLKSLFGLKKPTFLAKRHFLCP